MISIGLISVVLFLFLIRFLFKIKKNNSKKTISNNNIYSAPNIKVKSKSITSKELIETFEHPVKKQNSFLNPNDDFGTLKKGVVLDNQTYEYEINENDSSNLTIIELGDETKEIGE
jgi:hypothetical protein